MSRQLLIGQGLLNVKVPRSYSDTPHGRTPLDEWLARRRDLYLTTHNTYEQTGIHAPGGIRTRSPSKRAAAADRRLTRRGHWDRLQKFTVIIVSYGSMVIPDVTCFNKRTLTLSVLLPRFYFAQKSQLLTPSISDKKNMEQFYNLRGWIKKIS